MFMPVSERIKLMRLLKGMAQYDPAAGTGARQSFQARYESLVIDPKTAFLREIAFALDTTPEWLSKGQAPVFTKSLIISDPVPELLPVGLKSKVIADLKNYLPSFLSSVNVSECLTILFSRRLLINILLFPEGSLLVLIGRNRIAKTILSAIKKSNCACTFLDASKIHCRIDSLLLRKVEQGAEVLRELLGIAAAAMSCPPEMERYIEDYRKNAQQDTWGFCLTAHVSRKGGLTQKQAMEELDKLMKLHKAADIQVEIARMA
jgi:transcriptional regulator with XRE-family HTH domain